MKTRYKTKRDINGNTYWLILDHEAKTYCTHFIIFIGGYNEAITVTRKQLRELKNEAIENGYIERA